MSNRIIGRYFPLLPSGWSEMPIGAALEEIDRPINMRDSDLYQLVSIRRRNGGMFHRESLPGRKILTKSLREVVSGTFVIARMQIVHGASALASNDFAGCAISKSYSSFQGTARCDANYFSWLAKLPFMYAYFLDSSHGVVIEKMTFDQQRWMSLPVYLPPPREQRRIVAVLDTLDDAIRSVERVIAKLELVKQGLFHDLLTRGIDQNGELRDPVRNPQQFADTALGRFPREWTIGRCGDLCREIVVGIVIRPTQWYASGGVPVLRSANVREDGLDMSDLMFMTASSHRALAKSAVSPGDVVTVRTGYPGTTAVIPPSVAEANCVDIIISRPGPLLLPHYLSTWVNAPIGKGQVLAKQGGLAQQHFNVSEMKELLVALPPLAEQAGICNRTAALQEQILDERKVVQKLALLKDGLMNDLLTGRVRVSVADEDAA